MLSEFFQLSTFYALNIDIIYSQIFLENRRWHWNETKYSLMCKGSLLWILRKQLHLQIKTSYANVHFPFHPLVFAGKVGRICTLPLIEIKQRLRGSKRAEICLCCSHRNLCVTKRIELYVQTWQMSTFKPYAFPRHFHRRQRRLFHEKCI